MVDIHKYQRQLDRTIENIKKSNLINEENKQTILGFYRFCLTDGISAGKVLRYIDDAYKLAKWVKKDLPELTKTDMEEVIIQLDKQGYAEWTKYCFKVSLRKFFKWMRNSGDELPPEVKWIKMRQKNCNNKLPEDLITEEEVKKMITHARKARERSLIAVLYESGCRIHELLNLRMKHITFDTYGGVISVSGKTGSRRVRLVTSVVYLQDWLNEHPCHDDPEAFIFIKHGTSAEIVGYDRVRHLLTRIAKSAGIKKKVNPHNFRHSRASLMANHMTEAQLKEIFGWTQASRMASVYVHLSGRNTDQAVLKMYGRYIEHEKTIQPLTPIDCFRCKKLNEPTNKFCKVCGIVLDDKARMEFLQKEFEQRQANQLMDSLMKDKEVLEFLTKKLKESRLPAE